MERRACEGNRGHRGSEMSVAESNKLRRKHMTPEAAKAAQRASINAWKARNPEKIKEYFRRYRKKRVLELRSRVRAYQMHKKYRISPEDYTTMLSSQGGVCAVCGGVNPSGRRLAIDHCHSTGKVRGLLCTNCNLICGHAGDSTEILEGVIKYLRNSK